MLDSGFTYSIKPEKSSVFNKNYIDQLLLFNQSKIYECGRGHAQKNLDVNHFMAINIPFPPLEIQRQIVDEIAAHQRIIDGARQVVEGWRPNIALELDKILAKGEKSLLDKTLSEITDLITKGTTPTTLGFKFEDKGVNFIKVEINN